MHAPDAFWNAGFASAADIAEQHSFEKPGKQVLGESESSESILWKNGFFITVDLFTILRSTVPGISNK